MSERSGGATVTPPPPPPPTRGATPSSGAPGAPTGIPKRSDTPTARSGELLGVLAAGFLGNLVLRTGVVSSLAGSLVVVGLVAVLLGSARVRRGGAVTFVVSAVALAPWLAIRSDTALTAATVVAIVVLLGVGCGFSLTGSAFDARVRNLVQHVAAPIYEWFYGFEMVVRFGALRSREHALAPLLRGIVLAVPVLVVFTALLASADDVFARFLLLDDLPSVVGHVLLTIVVAIGLFGWVSLAAHRVDSSGSGPNLRMLGPFEVTMILGGLATLFAGFVATQVVVAVGGADHVLETEGLTQADHAREGFFQLLRVAGLAASLVGALRAVRIVEPVDGRDRFRGLGLLTLGLTLVIAVVSMQRLLLYVDAFGLTPLRFWALAGAAGVALLIAVYAASIAGWRAEQSWFPGVAILVSAVFVFGLNVLNPDNLVAEVNVDRNGSALDVGALSTLSDDAVVTMIDALPELDERTAERLAAALCVRPNRSSDFGVFDHNVSRVAADRALDRFCSARTAGPD